MSLLPECAVTGLRKLRGEHQPFEPDRTLRIAVLQLCDQRLALREVARRDQRHAIFVPEMRQLGELLRRFLAPPDRACVIAMRGVDLGEQRDGIGIVGRVERELIGAVFRRIEFALADQKPSEPDQRLAASRHEFQHAAPLGDGSRRIAVFLGEARKNRRPVLVVGPFRHQRVGQTPGLVELAVVDKHLCQPRRRHTVAGVFLQTLAPERFGFGPILGLLGGARALPQFGRLAPAKVSLGTGGGAKKGVVAVALLNHTESLRDLSRDKGRNAHYKARSGVKDNRWAVASLLANSAL